MGGKRRLIRLVYPGKQVDMFTSHSIGMDGVVASIRLKNWRRGIEDAGYLQLAYAAEPKRAEAIARGLLPTVFSAAKDGQPASWSDAGKPWFDARKALLALVPRGTNGGAGVAAKPSPSGASGLALVDKPAGSGCRGCSQSGAAVFAFLLVFLAQRRKPRAGGTLASVEPRAARAEEDAQT